VIGGVGIPASIYAVIFLFIPAFQNSMERARIVSDAFEASKVAEAQAKVTPAPWSPPEESFDVIAVSNRPNTLPNSQRVFGKSKAYSLILPDDWEVTNDIPEHDFTASRDSLNFEVIYQPSRAKSANELLDIIKRRFQKNGAVDFTDPYRKEINNRQWIGFACTLIFRGAKSGSMTCLVHKSEKGVFILMYGSALSPKEETSPVFDKILNSFEIK
jgi:hypothetical protein